MKFALLIDLGYFKLCFRQHQFFEPETVGFSRCSRPAAEFEVTIVLSNPVDRTNAGQWGLSLRDADRIRIAGLIVICLFTVALFLPGHQSTSGGSILHQSDDIVPGWRLAILGWLGPLELCFAWFANLPLIICVVKMLRGKSPKQPTAVITACLALSVLLPQRIWQPADGWHTGHLYGAAVWLWLATFAVVVLASMQSESRELKGHASNAL